MLARLLFVFPNHAGFTASASKIACEYCSARSNYRARVALAEVISVNAQMFAGVAAVLKSTNPAPRRMNTNRTTVRNVECIARIVDVCSGQIWFWTTKFLFDSLNPFPHNTAAMAANSISKQLIAAAAKLRDGVDKLSFIPPVTHVYNPLDYAWLAHEKFLQLHGDSTKKVLFLGMNPGPFGMVQTGIPFGEIAAVRDWIGINEPVTAPKNEHPARPVEGFNCTRSEVSGRRLWGLFSEKYPVAKDFFADHFVVNYCPLVFMEETGRNRTPDKLPAAETEPLFEICDEHIKRVVDVLSPERLIGVGGFAEKCFRRIFGKKDSRIATVLHPSPASPAANRGWAEAAEQKLVELGVW